MRNFLFVLLCVCFFSEVFSGPVVVNRAIFNQTDNALSLAYAVCGENEVQVIADTTYRTFTGILEIPASIQLADQEYAVRAIGDSAFAGCDLLQGVRMPASITRIGNRAFYECNALTTLEWGDAVCSVGEEAFYNCRNITTLTLPATLTSIGMKAFANMSGVKTVRFLSLLPELPAYLFYNWSSLVSVELPGSIKKIERYAFFSCSSLQSVGLSSSIEEIGEHAFNGCGRLNGLNLKDTRFIGQFAFYGCAFLKDFALPATLDSLGQYAFYGCRRLSDIILPVGITRLQNNTFYGASALKTVRFEGAIKAMGNSVFQNCESLESCILPKSLTQLGNNAFKGCSSLEEVVIGDSLLHLGTDPAVANYTFEECRRLKKVVLGRNLTAIGDYSFSLCTALEEIHYTSSQTPVQPGATAFRNVPATCKVYVNNDLVDIFKSTEYWKKLSIVGNGYIEPVYWIGEGENKASIAISWKDEKLPAIQLWGYRWKGNALSLQQVLQALVKADPRLFSVVCKANQTLSGLGFDLNGKNSIGMLVANNLAYPRYDMTGWFEATSDNYNQWQPIDREDHWNAITQLSESKWSCYLKGSDNGWSVLPDSMPATMVKNGDYLNWVFDADNWQEWKNLPNFTLTDPYVKETINYTQGFFVVNEDWQGYDNGSVNFVTDANDWKYRAFRVENTDAKLGPKTRFGTIYGDNFYFVSQQPTMADELGKSAYLVVADAKTLRKKASLTIGDGCEGGAFLGIDAQKGYIGTDNGIFGFDIASLTVGEPVMGIATGEGQIGDMVRAGEYVFALQHTKGVLVIDPATDRVMQTFAYPNASMMTFANDRRVWIAIATENKLVAIDPVSFEAEEVICPAGVTVSTMNWHAGDLCAATNEKALYLATGTSGRSVIVKYDIESHTFNPEFFVLPDQETANAPVLYGAGMRMNPLTGKLVITAIGSGEGIAAQKNFVYLVDGQSGELQNTLIPEDYYWFPAMPVFTDRYDAQITLPEPLNLEEEEVIRLPLQTLVSDADNADVAIRVRATVIDPHIASAAVVYPDLILTAHACGNTTIELVAESNGKETRATLPITVAVGTGMRNQTAGQPVTIYPNPTKERLVVNAPQGTEIQICDLNGRQVLSQIQSAAIATLDLSNLPAGIYLLRAESEAGIEMMRFVKE